MNVISIVFTIVFAILLVPSFANGQALLLPSSARFARGEGDCKDVYVAVASPHWRVREGDVFEVSAVHQLIPVDGMSYQWKVANGRIVSGQGTSRAQVKAGGKKTSGYLNVSGFVDIRLLVTKKIGAILCGVEASHTVMVGRHREVNQFANVNDISLDQQFLVSPCPAGCLPAEGRRTSEDMIVGISTSASDPENDVLTYSYVVSAGTIGKQGANVEWDLTGVRPGKYSILVGVDDGSGILGNIVSKEIIVRDSVCICDVSCATITISGPQSVTQEAVFTANVSGGDIQSVTYEWSISGGVILEGQSTPTIRAKIWMNSSGGKSAVKVVIGGAEAGLCINSATKEYVNGKAKP